MCFGIIRDRMMKNRIEFHHHLFTYAKQFVLESALNCEQNIYRAKSSKRKKKIEEKRIKCIIMANPEQQLPTYILALYKYNTTFIYAASYPHLAVGVGIIFNWYYYVRQRFMTKNGWHPQDLLWRMSRKESRSHCGLSLSLSLCVIS